MATFKAMFGSAQWVGGEQRTQAEIELDHVIGLRGDERVINVPASELMILTSGDLPRNLVQAIRQTRGQAYRAWTEQEEAALREMWERGEEIKVMTEALGRQWGALRMRARRMGLPARPGGDAP
ncbi:hypothetical protein LO762_15680 [Actinocorallia sp. API 0066]|uniref:hypothetical protein n=1 Tax=Actinocorallia sp. API 0066 TaxID=2896846 RepID=UPI001E431E3E|nr:hypothetical protein [Actinocorallia sp. API 0066]MCD0450619.1 hypothetical protein [Actinocorallia sp. API 0066]